MARRRNSLDALLTRTIPEGDCLIWQGALASDGRYGSASFGDRTIRVHRLVYQLVNGPISEGAHVLHRCDRPLCINPGHLFEGDNEVNVADRHAKGRTARGVGLNHPHRVLNDDLVREMRELRRQGLWIKDLAQRFGCSKSTVISVTLNRTWRHVA